MRDLVKDNNLNVKYNARVQSTQSTGVTLEDGSVVEAKAVLIAAGLKTRPLSDKERIIYESTFPNAQMYTYENAPIDCDAYASKHVFVFGNGNAATELSSFIIEEVRRCMFTWYRRQKPVLLNLTLLLPTLLPFLTS